MGSDVNLGNIPTSEIVGLETLRLGLRSDTLMELIPPAPARAVPAGRFPSRLHVAA